MHLLVAFQILLIGIAHTLGVVQIASRVETYQVVVGYGVVFHNEMHVVAANALDAVFGGKTPYLLVHLDLMIVHELVARIASGMKLHFQIVILTENLLEFAHHRFGTGYVAAHDGLRKLAAKTRGTAYQAFVILPEKALVDTRLVVEALGPRVGDYLAEIVVASQIFRQQYQVVAGLFVLVPFETVFHHVYLAAQNRFYTLLFGCVAELLDTVHVAVVGDCERRHAQLLGAFENLTDGGSSVQNRILGMYVQMNELRHNEKGKIIYSWLQI